MIRSRVHICRQLQAFFETELRGLYQWGAVEILPSETALAPAGVKLNRRQKYRDAVVVVFGPFRIEVVSAAEAPPLGSVVLTGPGESYRGKIDAETWAACGSQIRSTNTEGKQHERRIA